MPKILLSWSSGKDSAWSLHLLRRQGAEVAGLLTTVNQAFDRVAMHAVRRTLVEAQAAAAGLPLWTVPLPWPCSNAEYERIMSGVCAQAVAEGYTAIAFGDLFLTEIRAYRLRMLEGTGLQPLFPVWDLPTTALAEEMIASGLKAKITCVDPRVLPAAMAGKDFDAAFVKSLPEGADPCGENGEFHSFVYAGPMFRHEVPVKVGEVVERDGFVFADVLPAG
jgi:uncharacterized protein (TIGR00290 family)